MSAKWSNQPSSNPDPSSLGGFLSNLESLKKLFEGQLAREQENLLRAQQELARLEAQAKTKTSVGNRDKSNG
jgi:hypothetical protein